MVSRLGKLSDEKQPSLFTNSKQPRSSGKAGQPTAESPQASHDPLSFNTMCQSAALASRNLCHVPCRTTEHAALTIRHLNPSARDSRTPAFQAIRLPNRPSTTLQPSGALRRLTQERLGDLWALTSSVKDSGTGSCCAFPPSLSLYLALSRTLTVCAFSSLFTQRCERRWPDPGSAGFERSGRRRFPPQAPGASAKSGEITVLCAVSRFSVLFLCPVF